MISSNYSNNASSGSFPGLSMKFAKKKSTPAHSWKKNTSGCGDNKDLATRARERCGNARERRGQHGQGMDSAEHAAKRASEWVDEQERCEGCLGNNQNNRLGRILS